MMHDKKYVIILSYNEVKQIKEYVLNNSICYIIKILCIKDKKIIFMVSNLKRYGYENVFSTSLFVNGFNAVERPSTKENLEGVYKVSSYSSETYYIKEK
jgi:hypothetical protein